MNPEEMQEPVDNPQEEGQEPDTGVQPEWHDPNMDPSQVQEMPDEQHPSFQPEPSPMEALPDLILTYIDYATGIRHDETLDKKIQSDIMSALANSIATLVPLLKDDSQMEIAKMQMEMQFKQQELELKKEEMAMNLQMKQEEMNMKAQEHQQKLQFNEASNQQTLQQKQEQHQHNIVQSQQSHETKMEQQKQAAQLKQSGKPVNKGPKK